jgi:hypothetical protein
MFTATPNPHQDVDGQVLPIRILDHRPDVVADKLQKRFEPTRAPAGSPRAGVPLVSRGVLAMRIAQNLIAGFLGHMMRDGDRLFCAVESALGGRVQMIVMKAVAMVRRARLTVGVAARGRLVILSM